MKQSRPPVSRMRAIDKEIRAKRFPDCARLAGLLNADRHHILNDIAFMRECLGAPVAYDETHCGYYYEKPWSFLPVLPVDSRQRPEGGSSGRLTASCYPGAGDSSSPDSARPGKRVSGAGLKNSAGRRGGAKIPGQKLFTGDAFGEHPGLEEALQKHHRVRFTYEDPLTGDIRKGVLHPYRFYFSGFNLTRYLVAFCESSGSVQAFDLCCFSSLRILKGTFTMDRSFSLEEFFEKLFGEDAGRNSCRVRIRFGCERAQWIKRKTWHPTQKIEDRPDGSVVVGLDICGLEAVKRWVLYFGSDAEVLEPEELRFMVKKELVKMSERYLHAP